MEDLMWLLLILFAVLSTGELLYPSVPPDPHDDLGDDLP